MSTKFDLPEQVMCVDAHPSTSLLAAGCVDGGIHWVSFDEGEATPGQPDIRSELVKSVMHKASVRRLKFSKDGASLFAITKNKALTEWDTETGKKKRCIRRAHPDAAPYSMAILSEFQLGTGDESGCVNLWDWRSRDPAPMTSFQENDDYITDMTGDDSGRYLLVTSGDATLTAFNVKKKAVELQSEEMHSELTSVVVEPESNKVVCGGADGYLELFNYGEYGNIVDRHETSHVGGVDCLVALRGGSGLIVSGSADDGDVILHHVMPNKQMAVIGRIEDGVEFMVEEHGGDWLITGGGTEETIRYWPIKTLAEAVPSSNDASDLNKWKKAKHLGEETEFFKDL